MAGLNKSTWQTANWNAYVTLGENKEERIQRLAEVPEIWRDQVRDHVRTVFKIKARRKHG